jgi:hypothetical protein
MKLPETNFFVARSAWLGTMDADQLRVAQDSRLIWVTYFHSIRLCMSYHGGEHVKDRRISQSADQESGDYCSARNRAAWTEQPRA